MIGAFNRLASFCGSVFGRCGSAGAPLPPLSAPQNVVATPGDGIMTLSWDEYTGGAEDGFNYYFNTVNNLATATYAGNVPADSTQSYPFGGLTNGTLYYFWVRAASGVRLGRPSAVVTATPSGFDPLSIADLALWLDGADFSTMYDSGGVLATPGAAVARLNDKSGGGFHALQNTANNQPLRRSGTLSGLDFNGVNNFMLHGLSVTGPCTVFAVAIATGAATIQTVIQAAAPSASLIAQIEARASSANWGAYYAGWVPSSYPAGPGWTVMCNRVRAGNDRDFVTNGGAPETTTSGGYYSDPNERRIIGGVPDIGQSLEGLFGETLIYNRVLNDTEMGLVNDYLVAKWGGQP